MKKDEIRIENLEIYAYHGVFPEENEKGQTFFVNAVLYTDTRPAGIGDDLSLSTDYGAVCHFLKERMCSQVYQLIETVAEKLAEDVLLNFPLVHAVDLEVRKPEAPIGLPFGSVSVKVHRGWHLVYLSTGSNMGDRENYIRSGIEMLREHPCVKEVVVSELSVTKPYGGVEQEDFLNGAISLQTLLSPRELLEVIHGIEAAAGRERTVRWGPRTLDLDILFYDKVVYEDDQLQIPHIDMENREFVLEPLAELAPYLRHPVLGKTVVQLLEECRRDRE